MNRAFDARLYYPCLLVALTLPEVCMGLGLAANEYVKEKHYISFIDTYTTPRDVGCDGKDCYRLRGGMVHRGNAAGHPNFDWTHVLFCVPESRGSLHALTLAVGEKRAAMLDLDRFRRAIGQAVIAWYEEHSEDPLVIANLSEVLRWRPDGVPPFVGNSPLLGSGN